MHAFTKSLTERCTHPVHAATLLMAWKSPFYKLTSPEQPPLDVSTSSVQRALEYFMLNHMLHLHVGSFCSMGAVSDCACPEPYTASSPCSQGEPRVWHETVLVSLEDQDSRRARGLVEPTPNNSSLEGGVRIVNLAPSCLHRFETQQRMRVNAAILPPIYDTSEVRMSSLLQDSDLGVAHPDALCSSEISFN